MLLHGDEIERFGEHRDHAEADVWHDRQYPLQQVFQARRYCNGKILLRE